ncbi:MAG: serine/threonine-protein kinase, partial [Myxococcota bacterium]
MTQRIGDASPLGHQASLRPLHGHIANKVRARLFAHPAVATQIGRYTVLERVGYGGMGTVYSAYDQQLDRKVAIKILRDDELLGGEHRLRFLREAKALARLSHPNVVTIHEASEADGELFLAMEFIHGQTLGTWLRTKPHWRLVLDAFGQAGRGLAAAHHAGLIHRDLKPHNIMRSVDGVVKLLDFGLARSTNDPTDELFDTSEASGFDFSSGFSLDTTLTHPGMVMGTPAYMSPEQRYGEAVDARSDQFSFCVALYEALYGERPYSQAAIAARPGSIAGTTMVRPAPADTKIPATVRKAL